MYKGKINWNIQIKLFQFQVDKKNSDLQTQNYTVQNLYKNK